MKVHCHSNLDLNNEKWPEDLPCRPVVGDLIQSLRERGRHHFRLELQVVRVTIISPTDRDWENYHRTRLDEPKPYLDVELHMPPHRFDTISKFQEWYQNL